MSPTILAFVLLTVVTGAATVLLPAAVVVGCRGLGRGGRWLLQGAVALAAAELFGLVAQDVLTAVAGPPTFDPDGGVPLASDFVVRQIAVQGSILVLRMFGLTDDRIIMASEMGVLPIPEKDIVTKWRLQPGKMLLVDLDEGRLIPDEELKATLARSHPYKEWLERTQIVLEDLPGAGNEAPISNLSLLDRQQTFGYTQEDLKILMTPMASTGEEAIGSMGNDTPISALSDKPKPLFTYFKQNFAQVTNPPIDPIREELVMSLVSIIGPRPNLFDLEGMSNTKRLEVRQPILTNDDLEKIRSISEMSGDHFKSLHLRHHLPGRARRRRHGLGDRQVVRARRGRSARRLQHHHSVRPQGRRRPRADPGAARLRRRASSSDPQGPAHLGRPGAGDRRAARGASLRVPGRLRRRSDQSLSRLRDADRDEGRPAAASSTTRKSSSATSSRSTRACSR